MDTENANKATYELQFSFILQLDIPTKLEKLPRPGIILLAKIIIR